MIFFLACALTVAIETPFLALTVSREREYLKIAALINIVTNLALNLTLSLFLYVSPAAPRIALFPLEGCAVAAEFLVYRRWLAPEKPLRLFLLTLAANVLSYTAGVLIFGR